MKMKWKRDKIINWNFCLSSKSEAIYNNNHRTILFLLALSNGSIRYKKKA
jgi:hypothetical protein